MTAEEKVEKIREEIEKEAAEKAEAVYRSAREEAKRREEEGRAQIDAEFRSWAQGEKKEIQLNQKRSLSKAVLYERNRKLRVQAELIEDTFRYVEEKLKTLRDDPERYKNIVKALIIEATQSLADDRLTIQVDGRDDRLIDEDFLGTIEIIFTFNANRSVRYAKEREFIQTLGGIALYAQDKRVSCVNTMEERLAQEALRLKQIIAELLMAEGD